MEIIAIYLDFLFFGIFFCAVRNPTPDAAPKVAGEPAMTAREGRAAGFCMKALRRQKTTVFAVNAVQKIKEALFLTVFY